MRCLACARQQQEQIYVASTEKVVFGPDERGKVSWKVPLEGFRLWAWCDSVCIVGSHEKATVMSLERRTGKELWRWSAEGQLVGVAMQSLAPDCTRATFAVERATEMLRVEFDAHTGQVLRSWTCPNELPMAAARPGAACPASPRG